MTSQQPLKIAVLGAGAMGCLIGGMLARCGADVTMVEINPLVVETVRSRGLLLKIADDEYVVPVRIGGPEDVPDDVDCILILTKSYHTRAALQSVRACFEHGARLLSLQNGLGHLDAIAEFVAPERTLIGVTIYPAVLREPGSISSAGDGHIDFGQLAGSAGDDFPVRLLEAFVAGNLSAAIDPEIMLKVWRKVAFNASLNPVCALTRRVVGDVGRAPDARAFAHRVANEVLAVGKAEFPALNQDDARSAIDFALDNHLTHKPSMLQDIEQGRRTEIDAICGAVVARAKRHNMAVPLLETLDCLVRVAEPT